MQMSPTRVCKVITACAVLHNISKDLKQPDVDFEADVHDDPHMEHIAATGIAIRQAIIQNYFS